MTDSLRTLLASILEFRDARDWAQFHTPRNLAAALAIEAAELQETLLWKSDGEVTEQLAQPDLRRRVEEESADVLIFALLFCHATGIDPAAAIRQKLTLNAQKYPVEHARGSAAKYTELPSNQAPRENP